MLRLGGEDEARIVSIICVSDMIVMVHPTSQPDTELVDERERDLAEPSTATSSRKGDIQHHHTPLELSGLRQLAWCAKRDVLH